MHTLCSLSLHLKRHNDSDSKYSLHERHSLNSVATHDSTQAVTDSYLLVPGTCDTCVAIYTASHCATGYTVWLKINN